MPALRPSPLLLICLSLACGGFNPDTGSEEQDAGEQPLNKSQHVVDNFAIPPTFEAAQEYGLEVDESSQVRNRVGVLLGLLNQTGYVSQAGVAEAVRNGESITLLEMAAPDGAQPARELTVFDGGQAEPEPCAAGPQCGDHLGGSATFGSAVQGSTDAAVLGAVNENFFETTSVGSFVLQLRITGIEELVSFPLIAARAEFAISADGGLTGTIAGAISASAVAVGRIAAIVTTYYTSAINLSCTGTFPNCCEPGSTAEQLLNEADPADMDCQVTEPQVAASPFVAGLVGPDVDLLDGDTYGPNRDGISESLSFGVKFTAVSASF